MDTLTAIHQRHSCRAYAPKHVSDHDLVEIVRAGQQAPIANAQYTYMQLTVVQSRKLLDTMTSRVQKLTANLDANPFYNVPTLIVISTNSNAAEGIGLANMACVAQNMLLAATSLGLSSILVTNWARVLRDEADLLRQLKLERTLVPVGAVCVGYPLEDDVAVGQPVPRRMVVKYVR